MPKAPSLRSRMTLWRLPRLPATIVAVLLIGLIVLGWYAAHRGAKRLVEPLRWLGQVQYDDYHVGLDGDVEFINLRIAGPRGELLGANHVEVETPGLFWLMRAARFGQPRTDRSSLAAFFGRQGAAGKDVPVGFPETSSLRVTLTEPRFSDLVRRFADLRWLGLGVAAPFAEDGCGLSKPFDRADLKALRLPDNPLRVVLSLNHDETDKVRLGVSFEVDDVSRADFGMVVRWPEPKRLLDANWQQVVLLERTWDVVDRGWVSARNRFCSRRLATTREDYIEKHLAAVRARIAAYGATPSDDVFMTYRRYVMRGGELHWRAAPSPAMALGQFERFRPAEQLRILNASLEAVRGRAVRFAFEFAAPPPVGPGMNPDGTPIVADGTAPPAADANAATAEGTTVAAATGTGTGATVPATPVDPLATTDVAPAGTTPTDGTATAAVTPPTATPTPSESATPPATAPATGTTTAPNTTAATAPATPDAAAAAASGRIADSRPPVRGAPRIDPLQSTLPDAPRTASTPPATPPPATNASGDAAPTPFTDTTTETDVAEEPVDTRLAALTPPDHTGAERVVVEAPTAEELADMGDLVYEDLENFVGRRVVIRSRYNSIRTGVLLKYTSVAITLRLEGRQAGLELSMPRQTVRDVVSID